MEEEEDAQAQEEAQEDARQVQVDTAWRRGRETRGARRDYLIQPPHTTHFSVLLWLKREQNCCWGGWVRKVASANSVPTCLACFPCLFLDHFSNKKILAACGSRKKKKFVACSAV